MIPTTMIIAGQEMPAALCADCGARIFPVEDMAEHARGHLQSPTPPPYPWTSHGVEPKRRRRKLVKQGAPRKDQTVVNINQNIGRNW